MNRQHIGTHAPGTYVAYRQDGCRCYPCSGARAAYDADRGRRLAAGTWQPFVPAGPVREHLLYLSANGVGLRRIEQITGMSRSSLRLIIEGCGGRPTRERVRTERARIILAIRPGIDTVSDGALLDCTGSVRRIQALIALGYSAAFLAGRLGISPGNFAGLGKFPTLTGKKARAIRALYNELSMKKPEALGLPKGSITRARNHAAFRGWAKPLNWDDDEIDNPDAQPHYGMPAPGEKPMKRSEQLLEDALHIIDNSPVDLAERWDRQSVAGQLGIGIDYLDKLLKQAA